MVIKMLHLEQKNLAVEEVHKPAFKREFDHHVMWEPVSLSGHVRTNSLHYVASRLEFVTLDKLSNLRPRLSFENGKKHF
jgi:hypothetical protein